MRWNHIPPRASAVYEVPLQVKYCRAIGQESCAVTSRCSTAIRNVEINWCYLDQRELKQRHICNVNTYFSNCLICDICLSSMSMLLNASVIMSSYLMGVALYISSVARAKILSLKVNYMFQSR